MSMGIILLGLIGIGYINNTICYNRRERFSTEIENVFVDILLPITKPILIGNVYRSPDQSGFLDKLSNAILNTPNFDSLYSR